MGKLNSATCTAPTDGQRAEGRDVDHGTRALRVHSRVHHRDQQEGADDLRDEHLVRAEVAAGLAAVDATARLGV
jgi:hypothetical protein